MENENEYKEKFKAWIEGLLSFEEFFEIDQEYQKKCFELNKFENICRSVTSMEF